MFLDNIGVLKEDLMFKKMIIMWLWALLVYEEGNSA